MRLISKVFSSMASAFRLLGSFPANRYAVTYFGLIPIFGFVYCLLPGQFYHANVAHEPMVGEDETHIGDLLKQEIIRNFKAHYGADKMTFGDWTIDTNSFAVRSLKASVQDVAFRLHLDITNSEQSEVSIAPMITFAVSGGAETVAASELKDKDKIRRFKKAKIDIPYTPFTNSDKQWGLNFAKALFPEENPTMTEDGEQDSSESIYDSSLHIYLPLSYSLDRKIFNLAKGMNGDPSELSGHWLRMMYLSAVTITTLGYGDISPLTPLARGLICLEAVMGIIIIGLFLNALTKERTQKKEEV
jgi:hypothetical protein